MNRFIHVLLLLVTLSLTACAGTGRLRYDSPQEAYEKGMSAFEKKRYDRAIEYFQATFDYGRTHEWADDAQIMLARAYLASKQYILAASEYTRFAELYRADPRAAEAEYERAQAYAAQAPNYELDQTATEQAIQYYQLFINRYPQHDKAAEAEARIRSLRGKIARKAYEAGLLYERRELYEAAAMTYERAFADYPDTEWADDALVGAVRAYKLFADESVRARQDERYRKALEHYERFTQIYADSPLRNEAEDLYTAIQQQLGTLAAQR